MGANRNPSDDSRTSPKGFYAHPNATVRTNFHVVMPRNEAENLLNLGQALYNDSSILRQQSPEDRSTENEISKSRTPKTINYFRVYTKASTRPHRYPPPRSIPFAALSPSPPLLLLRRALRSKSRLNNPSDSTRACLETCKSSNLAFLLPSFRGIRMEIPAYSSSGEGVKIDPREVLGRS
jgi:hypothetical protein